MDKRRLSTWFLIGLVIGSAGVVVALSYPSCSPISDGVPVSSADGMGVTVTGDTCMAMESQFPDANTVEVKTSAGNVTFISTGVASATIHKDNITGTWTYVSGIDATANDITINPSDKPRVVVGKDIDTIEFRDPALDDQTVDFTYSGVTGTTSKVTVYGVPTETRIAAVEQGQVVDESTSSTSGVVTFTDLPNSQHSIQLQTFDPHPPILENRSPDGPLSSPPSDASIDVSDGDFPRTDSVEVNITIDGTQEHSETITANQTVSTPLPQSAQTGGQHTVIVEAEDKYGETNSESWTYSVPDKLYIRNETDHSQLIDSPITSNLTFFGDDAIYNKSTSNGTINLNGLPVNQDFIVEVEPSDSNYTTRTYYLQSIYEQQTVYLLNTSAYTTVESRFTLEDPTGQYGSDTVMQVQRPISINGSTTWQAITADEFGVEGVTVTLEEGQRYRIKVIGETSSQIVGPYRADTSEAVTVTPGTPSIELGEYEDGWAANANIDNRTLEYRYSDPQDLTDQLIISIHEKNNKSNQLQPNETYFNVGNVSRQIMLTENESQKTWIVVYDVSRDGNEFVHTESTSNNPNLVPDLSKEWRLVTGVGLILILAGAFSLLNASVGAVVVSLVGGILWWIGYLDGATTGAAVVIALFISIIGHIYKSSGP